MFRKVKLTIIATKRGYVVRSGVEGYHTDDDDILTAGTLDNILEDLREIIQAETNPVLAIATPEEAA